MLEVLESARDSAKTNVPFLHIKSAEAPSSGTFAESHHPAARHAFEVHQKRASAMGQVWSEAHATAFRELHQAYVLTALGLHRGRTAWPLAVGCGKSQSLVAFALAQSDIAAAGGDPLSLLVCIERVDHITGMYREMVEAGVPPHMIAVYHRKTPREVTEGNLIPSASLEEVSRFPFLIATHAMMLKGEDSISWVNTYRGRERDLVVWDESLIKSQGRHFDLVHIEAALGVLRAISTDNLSDTARDARDAVEYITRCTVQLRQEFTRAADGAEPRTVELPKLSPEDETRFLVGIVETLKGGDALRKGGRTGLVEFIEHVQRPVRVVPYVEAGRRVGVVHYLTRIPESLTRLIVLDASHNIRLLTSEHDSTLRVTSVPCDVKSFHSVTVRHIVQGAGRDKLDKELPRRESSTVAQLIASLKAYPAGEAVIVVTFKPDAREERLGKTHADHLRRHMKRAGIDPEEALANGKPRFVFLTWGQHVGVSAYAYCRHVPCVGVLRRDVLDIASQIVGQRADLLAPHAADPAEISRVVRSEMFHNIIQAAGRGSCRTTRDGAAEPMSLTLLCVETFPSEWWQAAMPGVVVSEECPGRKARAASQTAAERAVLDALEGLPQTHGAVSSRTLKVLAGLQSMKPNRYSELLDKIVAAGLHGWRRDGQSFNRCLFTDETHVAA